MGCHMRRPLGHHDAPVRSFDSHQSTKDRPRWARVAFGANALVALFAAACERGTPAPPTPSGPSGPPPTAPPIGAVTPVTGLAAEATCSRTEPGKASAQLTWSCGPNC